MIRWTGWLSAGAAAIALSGCMSMPFMGGRYVAADEVQTMFAGKTVYARNAKTKTKSVSYYTPDGKVRQLRNGRKRTGVWFVDGKGRMCLQMDDAIKPSCRVVVMGDDGVVKKYRRSNKRWKLAVVYERFVDGNVKKL